VSVQVDRRSRPGAEETSGSPDAVQADGRAPIGYGLAVFLLLMFNEAWLLGQPDQPDAVSLAGRLLLLPSYAVGLFLLLQRPRRAAIGLLRTPMLVVLVLVAEASVFWSVAPAETTPRIVALALTTLFGVALGARWRWSELVEVTAVAFVAMVVLSLVLGVTVPSLGRMTEIFPGAWRGLWVEKNVFGGLMAIATLNFAAAALFHPKRALFWGAMAALAILLLGLSTSGTAIVALLLGGAALGLTLLVRRGGVTAVAAIGVAGVGLVGLAVLITVSPDVLFAALGKDATLTGRTKIWAEIWPLIQRRPLLGYGYDAVWTDPSAWGVLPWITRHIGFTPSHAHNSWLEQWLALGGVGLTAWVLLYVSTMGKAVWAVFTNKGALLAFPFMVVYSLKSLTESVTLTYNDIHWVLFVAYAVRLSIPSEDERA
jgi:exopolysaccharide production protein ExoQ